MFERKWTYGDVFKEAVDIYKNHIKWILVISIIQILISGANEGIRAFSDNVRMDPENFTQMLLSIGGLGLFMLIIIPFSTIINFVLIQKVFSRYGKPDKPLGQQFKDACWNALKWFGCSLLIFFIQVIPMTILVVVGGMMTVASDSLVPITITGIICFAIGLPFMVMIILSQFEAVYYQKNSFEIFAASFKMTFKKGVKFAPWILLYIVFIGLVVGVQILIDKYMISGMWLKMGLSFVTSMIAIFYSFLNLVQYMAVDDRNKEGSDIPSNILGKLEEINE